MTATSSLSLFLAATTFARSVAASPSPEIYTGDYADHFHPFCERHIQVSSDGETFHNSGTASGTKDDTILRGCTPEEQETFGSRKGAFDVLILNSGEEIIAEDGIHEGGWEPAGMNAKGKFGEVDGVRWNDGNKWVRLSASISQLYVVDGKAMIDPVTTNNAQPADSTGSKKFGEWFFVAYVVFSLAAGAKEICSRLMNKINSGD